MTNDMKTINGKGVMMNKSLLSKVTSNLKLPKDPYLMPTLGINVKDSMLGLMSFSSNWGSFDIDLRKYTIKQILDNLKLKEKNYFNDLNKNFMAKNIIKNASLNLSKIDQNKDKMDN